MWIHSTSRGDEKLEQNLRNELAALAADATQSGLGLSDVADLPAKRRALQSNVSSDRNFGLLVQDAIERILLRLNLKVTLVDRGYDFEVYERGDADAETDVGRLQAGKQLIEVKAISGERHGSAPHTPPGKDIDSAIWRIRRLRSWLAGNRPSDAVHRKRSRRGSCRSCKDHCGTRLGPLLQNVEEASTGIEDVRIDQAQQLRYCLGEELWSVGLSLEDWLRVEFSENLGCRPEFGRRVWLRLVFSYPSRLFLKPGCFVWSHDAETQSCKIAAEYT